MPLLAKEDQDFIRKKFEQELEGDVTLVLFRSGGSKLTIPGRPEPRGADYSDETEELLHDLEELSPKIKVQVYSMYADKDMAERFQIDRTPAIAFLSNEKDVGIRFFGIPSGYEFGALLEDIIDVSKGKNRLAASTKSQLAAIEKDIVIKVFTTPT